MFRDAGVWRCSPALRCSRAAVGGCADKVRAGTSAPMKKAPPSGVGADHTRALPRSASERSGRRTSCRRTVSRRSLHFREQQPRAEGRKRHLWQAATWAGRRGTGRAPPLSALLVVRRGRLRRHLEVRHPHSLCDSTQQKHTLSSSRKILRAAHFARPSPDRKNLRHIQQTLRPASHRASARATHAG